MKPGVEGDNSVPSTTTLRFRDLLPGTIIRLDFSPALNTKDSQDIVIGSTGSYYADGIRPVYHIRIKNIGYGADNRYLSTAGVIGYQYEATTPNSFEAITRVIPDIGAYAQIVGQCNDVVSEVGTFKDEVTQICMSNWRKRPVEYLYTVQQKLDTELDNIFTDPESAKGDRHLAIPENALSWDLDFSPDEWFKDPDSMKYSPFSLYVIQDVTEIKAHAPKWGTESKATNDHPDSTQHLFEKYYIDKVFNAQTAEELLTAYTLAYKTMNTITDNKEKAQIKEYLDAHQFYVLDAWSGKLKKVGSEFLYDPSIEYNGENLDLREIEHYSLDGLEPTDTKLTIGNGVYGELFYQKVTKSYVYENSLSTVELDRAAIKTEEENNEKYRGSGYSIYKNAVITYDKDYKAHCEDTEKRSEDWLKLRKE